MKRRKLLLFGLLPIVFFFMTSLSEGGGDKEKMVIISTIYGDIKIKLYNETPLHRDNFIKLASEGFFNDLLFHRVIKDFMIQGGDPDSKTAQPGAQLGNGGPGYNIPAEFVPGLIHRRGALAAAREADMVNPKKESSGSQFYIVQGKVFNAQELDFMEVRINQNIKNQIMGEILMDPNQLALRQRVDSLQKTGSMQGLTDMLQEYDPILEAELVKRGR
jgi:cyclophilin family peptidyl-prolyl cis-trans isomerase